MTIRSLISVVKREHIQVIIATKRKDYVLGGITARLCGIQNVLRLGIVRTLTYPWIDRVVYDCLADGIIVNAHSIKKVLCKSKFMRDHKIRVIYNGVDHQRISVLSQQTIEKPFPFLIIVRGRYR